MVNFREQLEQFYRAHYDELVRRAQNQYVSKHDAEDIVQEAFTRLLKFEHTFDGKNFEAWFFTILRNVVKDSHRDRIMRGMGLEDPEEEGAESDTETRLTINDIHDYIKRIDNPNKQWIASLYFIEGLTYREIDQLVPENLPAIRKTIQRIREDLQQHVL